MTDDRMALQALLEKGSDTDLLREMIGFVALAADGLRGGVAVWRWPRRTSR